MAYLWYDQKKHSNWARMQHAANMFYNVRNEAAILHEYTMLSELSLPIFIAILSVIPSQPPHSRHPSKP